MKSIFFLLLPFAVALSACDGDIVYSVQSELEADGWRQEQPLTFDVTITDTAQSYDVLINLRHTSSFPSQNLWLFTETFQPDSQVVRDTIECMLANTHGEWLGKGWGSLREMSVLYKQRYKFPQPGGYRFSIRHGMRVDALTGINDLGMEIVLHH